MVLFSAITALSSTALRGAAYVFLRWVPGHPFPPIIYTLFAIYVASFIQTWRRTSPYEVVADEIDIIATEITDRHDSDALDAQLDAGLSAEQPIEELEVQETLVLEEKEPQALKTLLSGLPSPTSMLWSAITFLTNLALVLMVTDYVFRAPLLHPEHDLSFARVGYISDHEAHILVREPRLEQLPVFCSYRYADPPNMHLPLALQPDGSWHSSGQQINWLSNDTDFTGTFKLSRLRSDTRYQYVVSTNHTGYFITAPPVGHTSKRLHSPSQDSASNTFTFLHSSCLKPRFPYNPFSHPLHLPGLQHLARVLPSLKAQFMLFLGDFIYIDVPHRFGQQVEHYRREYRQVYASPDWPAVAKELPWIHVYDDHEIANDWDGNTTGPYLSAADPYHNYHVSVNPPAVRPGATYFSFTQGPATFFLIDTRKYRDPINDNN
ncbi:hypothetical protein LTR66_011143, partial [Elasticomyces elasticus]